MKMFKILFILYFLFFFGCSSVNQVKNIGEVSKKTLSKNKEKSPNPEALRFYLDGQLLMNQGDYSMAIIEFQQALELDPATSAIELAIAECYWKLRKPLLSKKHINNVLKTDPFEPEALEMLADQMIFDKQYGSALDPLTKLTQNFPNRVKYLVTLAEVEKILGNSIKSIDHYLNAYKIDSTNLNFLETAGRYALESDNAVKALSIFKQLTIEDPINQNYLSIFTELISREGKFKEGITHIENLNETNGEKAFRNAEIGKLFYRNNEKNKAKDYLERSIENLNSNLSGILSLFEIYINDNQLSEAASVADKIISNFPDDWRGYYSRAIVYLNQENYKSMILLLEPIAEGFEKIFSIQYLLGIAYNRFLDSENAIIYFNKALSIEPNSKNALHSLAILYDEKSQWENSDEIYIKLINTDNKDAQAYNNYAYSLVERNVNLDQALEMAKKAIEIEPENPSYLDTIGWVYFKLSDFKKAKKYISQSVELNDKNAIVLEHLGDVLMETDETDEAVEFYKKALFIDQDNSRLKKKVLSD